MRTNLFLRKSNSHILPAVVDLETIDFGLAVLALGGPMRYRQHFAGRNIETLGYPISDNRVVFIVREASTQFGSDVPIYPTRYIVLGDLDVLTRRELEVFALLGEGVLVPDIATELGCAIETVRTHRKRLMAKLGCKTQQEAILYCRAIGFRFEFTKLERA